MPIRRNPAYDTESPAGQWKNPDMMKTLGDIIDKTLKADELDKASWTGKKPISDYDRGYAEGKQAGYVDGHIDGKAEGFRDGLNWLRSSVPSRTQNAGE